MAELGKFNIFYGESYGNFDGIGNVVDTLKKPSDIVIDKPFEDEFIHQKASLIYWGCRDANPYYFQALQLGSGDLRIYYGGTNYVTFTNTELGIYSEGIIKTKVLNNGNGYFEISLFGKNADKSYTQIEDTYLVAIANLPDKNIVISARNNNGVIDVIYSSQQYFFKIYGEEFNFNKISGSDLIGSKYTSLTVVGTLTSFWYRDGLSYTPDGEYEQDVVLNVIDVEILESKMTRDRIGMLLSQKDVYFFDIFNIDKATNDDVFQVIVNQEIDFAPDILEPEKVYKMLVRIARHYYRDNDVYEDTVFMELNDLKYKDD